MNGQVARAAAAVVLALAATACNGPDERPTPQTVERAIALGPIDVPPVPAWRAPIVRQAIEPRGLGWITGMEVTAPQGVRVTDAGITLDVEIDVIRVSDDAPALSLPPGFGVPVLQIRGDLPPGWRSIRATARAIGLDRTRKDVSIRMRVTGLAPVDFGTVNPVWRIPTDVGRSSGVTAAGSRSGETRTIDLATRLPAPGTIHALVPRTHGTAREVRLVSEIDGALVARLARPDSTRSLGAWSDPVGVRVSEDRPVRLELDLPWPASDEPISVDVYLRPDPDVSLGYPIEPGPS